MTDNQDDLLRKQIAELMNTYPRSGAAPRGGWVRAVREALGMTKVQLAARLGITRQSLQDLEHAEADRRITLESLDRLAKAMRCRVVYAVVPESGSLEDVRKRRAAELAEAMLKATDQSMRLEAQGVPARERARQKRRLVDSLLRGSPRQLWK